MEYEVDKYYAQFEGFVVGPYDSHDEAWRDTGGDVQWIELGKDIKE